MKFPKDEAKTFGEFPLERRSDDAAIHKPKNSGDFADHPPAHIAGTGVDADDGNGFGHGASQRARGSLRPRKAASELNQMKKDREKLFSAVSNRAKE